MEHDATAELTHGTAVPTEGPIPLLQPAYFDNLIFWAVVALVAIYFILSRMALPRIGSTLATREGTIASDLSAAEALRAQARDAQAAYDKAVAEARAESNRIAQATRDAIKADLDAALAQADAQIEARAAEGARAVAEIQSQAQGSVAEVARDTAREILRVLGGQVDETAVDRAVSARVGG
ncbi:F0F1 ATP synthase subunit B' [Rubellimicrobium aerolatum]|uniref:ATP synthase subunit b n=1 Tax=Rubellimicrobium aerolatum TaxID=490979 RepID=A0ABW0SG12_9RHOB|nr:F0F1 ATP synthase subunit B' [Rubellimicrobium aerolatum]MBP1805828.1 F-type H+-transporting ATPase subunit b [Rubellimicrobium aerolatum]